MPLNTRLSQGPRWPFHHRSAVHGQMPVQIKIDRRSTAGNDVDWDPVTGGLIGDVEVIYQGPARLVTNKDWRARRRSGRSDLAIQHAVRVQVPIRTCPPVLAYDFLTVTDAPNDKSLETYIFHVRNIMPSGNAWIRNILCDADVSHISGFSDPE